MHPRFYSQPNPAMQAAREMARNMRMDKYQYRKNGLNGPRAVKRRLMQWQVRSLNEGRK